MYKSDFSGECWNLLTENEMKNSLQTLMLVLSLLTNQFAGFSQQDKAIDLINDDIATMLPPLETLIDSAIANNPNVKFTDLQININKFKLEADRNLWTRNLGIQADGRYGTFNNFSTNTSEGQTPSNFSTLSSQFNYGIGAYIKLPIYDFVNRKNQINLANAELEQARNMAEFQRNEVRQLVIRQYNDLIVKHRLLKIKSKYFETSKINLQMTENEFSNGIIPLSEYARISESTSRTEADFESSKMDFLTSYMILEEIVGIKFNEIRQRPYESN
jgi:outer membrane protein TolC